ncbi:MAG: hypothetical protein V1799_12950 [bacterium]
MDRALKYPLIARRLLSLDVAALLLQPIHAQQELHWRLFSAPANLTRNTSSNSKMISNEPADGKNILAIRSPLNGIEECSDVLPVRLISDQNFPAPFNSSTKIRDPLLIAT